MAKISLLPAATSIDGSEFLPIVQERETRQTSMFALAAAMVQFADPLLKGDPGGPSDASGVLASVANQAIADGIDAIRVTGTQVVGDDGFGREFVYDPAVDAAYVAANPTKAVRDKNGRGFREAGLSERLLDDASNLVSVITAQGHRPLYSVASDHGFDATWMVLQARTVPGWAGDQDALNRALALNSAVCVTNLVGSLDIRSSLILSRFGQHFVAIGGPRSIEIRRHPAMTTSTMVVGTEDPAGGAGAILVEGFWFTHEGRISYATPSYPAGSLPGVLLKNDQAHIELHGVQAGIIRNCGGYGAAHGIRSLGSNGLLIDNLFWFGGVYDDRFAATKEAVSVINLASGSVHGHNTSIVVRDPQIYGSSAGDRLVQIGDKMVTAPRRCGPLYGILVNSCEDWYVIGGLIASMSDSAVGWRPDSVKSVNKNGHLLGVDLDESNMDCVSVFRASADYSMPDGLSMIGCHLNGQLVARNGLTVYNGPNSIRSLIRLTMIGCHVRATLGAAIRLYGVDGADITGGSCAGYNIAWSESLEQASAIVIAGTSRDVDVQSVRLGGGINDRDDDPTPNANGLSANGCKYGIYRGPNLIGIIVGRIKQSPFGKPGGAVAVAANDNGDGTLAYTFNDPNSFDTYAFAGRA